MLSANPSLIFFFPPGQYKCGEAERQFETIITQNSAKALPADYTPSFFIFIFFIFFNYYY